MKNALFTDPAEQSNYDRLMEFVTEYPKADQVSVRIGLIAGIMRMAASLLVLQSRRASMESMEHSVTVLGLKEAAIA